MRCDLAVGFLATGSFACFLPAIGISISFWPADAFLNILAGFSPSGSPPQHHPRSHTEFFSVCPKNGPRFVSDLRTLHDLRMGYFLNQGSPSLIAIISVKGLAKAIGQKVTL